MILTTNQYYASDMIQTTKQYSGSDMTQAIQHIPVTMEPVFTTTVSSISFNTSLPLLGVGLLTLLLSFCFCCYLWKLKKQSHSERGYRQLKYSSSSKRMKNDICPVCLDEFEQEEKLAVCPCKHGFHTKCLQQWLDQHNTCPMCKTCVSSTAGERTGLITSAV